MISILQDAIAAIFELVKYVNTNKSDAMSGAAAKALYDILKQLCDILGIIIEKKEELLDADIEALIEERKQARKAKNFARADEIRKELADKGILLEDTRQGVGSVYKQVSLNCYFFERGTQINGTKSGTA